MKKLLCILVLLFSVSGLAGDFEEGVKAYDTENYKKAFTFLLPFAKQGNAEAQFKLGYILEADQGVQKNEQEALEWYKKSAKQNYLKAYRNLGLFFLNKEKYNEAYKWFKKGAEAGNSYAQFYLGAFYAEGLGVKKDYEKAREWYKKSADQGNVDAQYYLGDLYLQGLGVKKDYAKAVELFKKSANQGYAETQYKLGIIYKNGVLGLKKDYKKAFDFLRKAADQNHILAKSSLAHMYIKGWGTKQNYQKAREIHKELITKYKHLESFVSLAIGSYDWADSKNNYTQAISYYEQLIKIAPNSPEALMAYKDISAFYFSGKGVPMNKITTYKYLRKCVLSPAVNDTTNVYHTYGAKCQIALDSLCKNSPWACK